MAQRELSDEQLIVRVASGDESALEALYDRYAGAVVGLAVKVLQDRAAAEEVAQEAFWRVWRHAGSFREQRGSFTGWLFSIAHRLAIDAVRRRRSRPQPAVGETQERLLSALPDVNSGVPEMVWSETQRERVRAAVAELPAEQFQVIELAYFHGLTRQEIADMTGEPLGTVHSRARLALLRLRKILEPADVDD